MKRFRDIKTLLLTGLVIMCPGLVVAQSTASWTLPVNVNPVSHETSHEPLPLRVELGWQFSPELRINSEMQDSQRQNEQQVLEAAARNLFYESAASRRKAWEFTLASMYTTEHPWKINLQYRFTDRQPDFLLRDIREHQFSLAARITF